MGKGTVSRLPTAEHGSAVVPLVGREMESSGTNAPPQPPLSRWPGLGTRTR